MFPILSRPELMTLARVLNLQWPIDRMQHAQPLPSEIIAYLSPPSPPPRETASVGRRMNGRCLSDWGERVNVPRIPRLCPRSKSPTCVGTKSPQKFAPVPDNPDNYPRLCGHRLVYLVHPSIGSMTCAAAWILAARTRYTHKCLRPWLCCCFGLRDAPPGRPF